MGVGGGGVIIESFAIDRHRDGLLPGRFKYSASVTIKGDEGTIDMELSDALTDNILAGIEMAVREILTTARDELNTSRKDA